MVNTVIIQIVNLALARCSYGPIEKLDDQRKEALDMGKYLPIAMDMVLSRKDWEFNQWSVTANYDPGADPVRSGLSRKYKSYGTIHRDFLTITHVIEDSSGETLPDHVIVKDTLWVPLKDGIYDHVVACGRGIVNYMDANFNIGYDRDKFIDYASDILASIAIGGIAGNAAAGAQIESRAPGKLAVTENGRYSFDNKFITKRIDSR